MRMKIEERKALKAGLKSLRMEIMARCERAPRWLFEIKNAERWQAKQVSFNLHELAEALAAHFGSPQNAIEELKSDHIEFSKNRSSKNCLDLYLAETGWWENRSSPSDGR